MLHFIPAWYQQDTWCENEQKWYVRRMHTEFDDTVKQVQLFHRSSVYPYQILLLGFSPNFRHFLHRQGVFHAPYWSCFDAIQEITRKKAQVFSYHNLNWPANVEFIYTPVAALALIEGERYAQIEFGEDGNPIQIDIYKDGRIDRRNLYDDRGFVSGTIVYVQGEAHYQDYLMDNGIWKMRHFQQDGHVEINPKYPQYLLAYSGRECRVPFTRMRYDSLEQVIQEVLTAYVRMMDERDLFCVAMHKRHAALLQRTLSETAKEKRVILSFFEDRFRQESCSEAAGLLRKAGCIITDSRENSRNVRAMTGREPESIISIPPYDTRVDSGVSQRLTVQNILVPVDGMEEEMMKHLLLLLGKYLTENDSARVHLLTRQADYGRESILMAQVQGWLEEAGFPEGWAVEEPSFVAENAVDDPETEAQRFFVRVCVDELSVTKCMREQRILVDLREVPELYLQITAVSLGMPQVVRTQTQFVVQGRNGVVLKKSGQLIKVLEHYLGSLLHWNDAAVYSYRLSRKYTVEALTEKWKEVIEFIG